MSTYTIVTGDDAYKASPMSAFPPAIRPFTEPISATEDRVFPKGMTLPDLIRAFHPGSTPKGIEGRFAFMTRDNKERDYTTDEGDQFVFPRAVGVSLKSFSESTKRLLEGLCHASTILDVPIHVDKDRKVNVIDSEKLVASIEAGEFSLKEPIVRDSIMFLVANCDIAKKCCVVRTINPGWWAVSYSGKKASNKSFFQPSIDAHIKAFKTVLHTDTFKSKYASLWDANSDPVDTNPGYPFFEAIMDPDNQPITRLKTVELFQNLSTISGFDWENVLKNVDARAGRFGLQGHPFAVAPLRRLQPGYKWAHIFSITGSGMKTLGDRRGFNSQRVAFMVPYAYNLMISPIATLLKTWRYFLPGCYHDGPSKTRRLNTLSKLGRENRLFLAEADYSNYDRFIPIDIIEDITRAITSELPNGKYWYDAMMHLHHGVSLIWPDYTTAEGGHAWVFQPGNIGLLSGTKPTSDMGSIINSILNLQTIMNAYGWSVEHATNYLTMYKSNPIGSRFEHVLIQSDDTALIAKSSDDIIALMRSFQKSLTAAGLKGAVEFADRFLMRSLQNGSDRPVPMRVFQNTLSNESPPDNELVFLAGLAARTDGLFGLKSVDAFQTGDRQDVTRVEAIFTKMMLLELRKFTASASQVSKTALQILDTLLDGAKELPADFSKETKSSLNKRWSFPAHLKPIIDNLRLQVTKALASYEQQRMAADKRKKYASWIYSLYKDQNVPSSAYLLDELIATDPLVSGQVKRFAAVDEAFFKYSTGRLGIKPLNW